MTSQPAALRATRMEYDAWGQLLMQTEDGRTFSAVVPVRAFPVSDPDHWISICDCHGQEILVIDDIGDVPSERPQDTGAGIIAARVCARDPPHPLGHAPRAFRLVRGNRSRLHHLPTQQRGRCAATRARPASMVDTHGIRYLIKSLRGLDGGSRRILEHFL